MKVKRHNKIIEIIEKYNVETQEELIEKLRLAGFSVTQATISRDIRELGLLKVLMSNGSYKYMRPDIDSGSGQIVFQKAFSNTVKSVTSSLNNIVIKTYPGMANAVAAYIDSLHDEEILGCVAGDDCIIIVARNVEAASFLSKKIQEIVSY